MTENIKPEVVAYLAPAGEASMNNVDHVITESELARKLDIGGIIQEAAQEAYSVPLVRISDYETLQAERDRMYAALRHMANMYGVDDYYSGKLRDKEIDRAVNSALESVMPTCKRDKKPCGTAGGYCLECPSGPRREWLSK